MESAESPHCIALQVATVRYSVEEKLAVTCDDAKGPWSDEDRHLLCKQAGVGSSPTVSTPPLRGRQKSCSEAVSGVWKHLRQRANEHAGVSLRVAWHGR